MEKYSRAEQPENADGPIEVTLQGVAKVTFVSEEQARKAYDPISVTLEGMVMSGSAAQPSNACSPIDSTPGTMMIEESLLQP